ncbi:uncharacterized protein [Drosophila pseudoobscura]|uniref:Single domain-containing protein n=1 Tax=Drosophila pseudoobscura pseudoobscura TaxID=46245 RepID=A0A6I8V878_DROPS|nr:uncharacterized protein LOC6903890 [Drosophila pseudoobscura]
MGPPAKGPPIKRLPLVLSGVPQFLFRSVYDQFPKMKYIFFLVLVGLMPLAKSLVHPANLGPSGDGKGCKGPKGDILPGEMVQDEKVCGVFYCATDKGDGFIHYCQLTATFAECSGTTVSTTVDFPDCCWLCVKDKKCDKEGGAEAGGAGGAGGAGVATEKPPP